MPSGSTPGGWEWLRAALDAGDPDGTVAECWTAKEMVRDVYLTDDPITATAHLDEAIDWCVAPQAGPELKRLGKFLRHWRTEILAYHTTGASDEHVEAVSLLIKAVKCSGRGFRNYQNYRLRILLTSGGTHLRQTHPPRVSDPAVPASPRSAPVARRGQPPGRAQLVMDL